MYARISEVTLVQSKTRVQADDPIMYERQYQGARILTTDNKSSRFVGPAKRYGVMYIDARDRICVVPDVWNPDEAMIAREVVEE